MDDDAAQRALAFRHAAAVAPPGSLVVDQHRDRAAVLVVECAGYAADEVRRSEVALVDIGVAAVGQGEFHLPERDVGVNVLVGELADRFLLAEEVAGRAGRLADDVPGRQSAERVAFGIGLLGEGHAVERDFHLRVAFQRVVVRRVELQAVSVAAVEHLHVGRLGVHRVVGGVACRVGRRLHVGVVLVADHDALEAGFGIVDHDLSALALDQRAVVGFVGLFDDERRRGRKLSGRSRQREGDRRAARAFRVVLLHVERQHFVFERDVLDPVGRRAFVGRRADHLAEQAAQVVLQLGLDGRGLARGLGAVGREGHAGLFGRLRDGQRDGVFLLLGVDIGQRDRGLPFARRVVLQGAERDGVGSDGQVFDPLLVRLGRFVVVLVGNHRIDDGVPDLFVILPEVVVKPDAEVPGVAENLDAALLQRQDGVFALLRHAYRLFESAAGEDDVHGARHAVVGAVFEQYGGVPRAVQAVDGGPFHVFRQTDRPFASGIDPHLGGAGVRSQRVFVGIHIQRQVHVRIHFASGQQEQRRDEGQDARAPRFVDAVCKGIFHRCAFLFVP